MGTPGIVIAGTNSGCGKTTAAMGVMAALTSLGQTVQPYKVGPDYIDPMFHTFLTGRDSRNLDGWMLQEDTIRYLYGRHARTADIAITEGVMGFYDGVGSGSIEGSTAHIAGMIGAPVILVVNAEAMSTSAAALVKGFAEFDRSSEIKGVLFNNVSGEGHYHLLKDAVEKYTGVTSVGYLPQMEEAALGSRHLGLVTSAEVRDLKEKAEILSQQVRKTVDLELVVKLSREAGGLKPGHGMKREADAREAGTGNGNPRGDKERVWDCLGGDTMGVNLRNLPDKPAGRVRIAVARDKAFCFYYRDSLDLLESLGAELVYFSPLTEDFLPDDIDGLYLGGGYPEIRAEELQENRTIKEDIRSRAQSGMPVYAECGGLMYLTESIGTLDGKKYGMVGLIPAQSRMTPGLKRFGYAMVKATRDNILCRKGSLIRAHEFHYSETIPKEGAETCFEVAGAMNSWNCGYVIHRVAAGYPHIHLWSNPAFAGGFVESCSKYRQERRA